MKQKVAYGQFYSTKVDYILDGLQPPPIKTIVEPFVGQGDLLNWSKLLQMMHSKFLKRIGHSSCKDK